MTVTVSPSAVATLVLLPGLARRWWRHGLALQPLDWCVLALFPLSLLAARHVWNWPAYGTGITNLVVVPLLLWLAARTLIIDEKARRQLASALFAGGALAAAWGLFTWFGGVGVEVDGFQRLVGPHYSPNHTALYLVRTLFLAAGITIAAPRRWRLLMAVIIGLLVLAVILTGSRGGLLLGLPAGALFFGWFALGRRPGLLRWMRQQPRLIRWGAGLLLGWIAVLVVFQWERLLNLQTVTLRVDIWAATLQLWQDHFLTGVGPGSFFWTYPAYLPTGPLLEPNQIHPHNLLLGLVATWGVLGIGWLLAVLIATFLQRLDYAALPSKSYWIVAGAGAGLVAGAAHGQMDAFFLLADLAGWNALAWAIIATVPGSLAPNRVDAVTTT